MDTFGFTKKKLLSLSLETRHKHMINWLSGFYQKLTTNRINRASLDLFTRQYNQILDWTEMNPFIEPDTDSTRVWLESISDRIHYHRSATGGMVRDHELLEKVQTKDLSRAVNRTHLDCHVALDGLRSLFNVGSIFRTCEAAGFNSVILGNTPGKEHPGVQKTAMGAHEWIKQEKTEDLAQTLMKKKKTVSGSLVLRPLTVPALFMRFHGKRKPLLYSGMKNMGSHPMSWRHVTRLRIFQCSAEKIPSMLPMPLLLSVFRRQAPFRETVLLACSLTRVPVHGSQ